MKHFDVEAYRKEMRETGKVIPHPFRAVKTRIRGNGSFHGNLFEGDIQIAEFRYNQYSWPTWKITYFSEASKACFQDFCDSLSEGETIEAIMEADAADLGFNK